MEKPKGKMGKPKSSVVRKAGGETPIWGCFCLVLRPRIRDQFGFATLIGVATPNPGSVRGCESASGLPLVLRPRSGSDECFQTLRSGLGTRDREITLKPTSKVP